MVMWLIWLQSKHWPKQIVEYLFLIKTKSWSEKTPKRLRVGKQVIFMIEKQWWCSIITRTTSRVLTKDILGPAYEDKRTGFGFASDVSFFNNVKVYGFEDISMNYSDAKTPLPSSSDIEYEWIKMLRLKPGKTLVKVYKNKAQTDFVLNTTSKEITLQDQEVQRIKKNSHQSAVPLPTIWNHLDPNRPWKLQFTVELLIQLSFKSYKKTSTSNLGSWFEKEDNKITKQWNRAYVISQNTKTPLFDSLIKGWNENDCFWVSFYSQKPPKLSWEYKSGKINLKLDECDVLVWWLKDEDVCLVAAGLVETKIDLNFTNISLVR